jgi:hypothetical protein
MSSPNVGAQISLTIHGHISATPELFASLLGGNVSATHIESSDAAIFAINPAAGIDQATIDLWRSYDELQTPRIVIVTVLDGMELDFDDAVMVANRVFDPLVTPYLVLHGESGTPIGTISLTDLTTTDYSTNPPTIAHADEELATMVADFQEEYLAAIEEMEVGAFAAGLIFPAVPVNPSNGLGLDIVASYLKELPSSSEL